MKFSLSPKLTACFVLDHRVFPHLDLDHIGESVEAGWRDGLSLGVWKVDKDSVLNTGLELD
jgi:phosphatidylinositol glycan class Z